MTDAETTKVEELAALYRTRLHDLSWFMRTLNEFIARKANAEDGVTGKAGGVKSGRVALGA